MGRRDKRKQKRCFGVGTGGGMSGTAEAATEQLTNKEEGVNTNEGISG